MNLHMKQFTCAVRETTALSLRAANTPSSCPAESVMAGVSVFQQCKCQRDTAP